MVGVKSLKMYYTWVLSGVVMQWVGATGPSFFLMQRVRGGSFGYQNLLFTTGRQPQQSNP